MEDEDQFFLQPQVEEVQDIELPPAVPIQTSKHQSEEPQHVHLKMVQVPKVQEYHYQSFHLEKHSDEQSEEEQHQIHQTSDSFFTEFYRNSHCVYQRHNNNQCSQVRGCHYFAGCFMHRNTFHDVVTSETDDISQIIRQITNEDQEGLPKPNRNDLLFNSHFESGNLFAAFKLSQYEYDLVMSHDVNSTGSNQWFYFSVIGMKPNHDYTFSVINFTKSDSLFNYGMAPAVYSMAQNQGLEVEKGWRRVGHQVSYKRSKLPRQNSRKMYYKLTFKISTSYEKDKLFIAHSYPYTFEKLNKFISDRVCKHKDLLTKLSIGKTNSGKNIQVLVITHQINKKRDNRKAIIVMARQHPGETQGSFVCEGVIDKLLNKNKESQFLLKNYVFYVIPMVNPDGVVFGNYRCNLTGKDLNRKWNITDKDQNCPEIIVIKTFLQDLSHQRQIRFILDLHGHSKKLNSFFYGNPCPEAPQVVRIYPYVCSKLSSAVQYRDCTFTSQQQKKKAARVHLSGLYHLYHVYTFQSSFYAYFKDGKKIQFTPKQYRQLGSTLVNALTLQLQHQHKYQQSFEFNFKKHNNKEYLHSPFVKYLMELKDNKQLLDVGGEECSGSDSKPQEGQLNNEEMQNLKPKSISVPVQIDSISKSTKVTRRGVREVRQYVFNKPIRNIRFLEMSKINAILPDKYQLGLQPIKKKEVTPAPLKLTHARTAVQSQTEIKNQAKFADFKSSDIESTVLANSYRIDRQPERRYSSMMRTNNRNIIFRFDVLGSNTSRRDQSKAASSRSKIVKNAFSQTMITFSRDINDRMRASQLLPFVDADKQYDKTVSLNNQLRIQPMRNSFRKETQFYFNGMIKKLLYEKQTSRSEQLSTKFILEKPLNVKNKEYSKK